MNIIIHRPDLDLPLAEPARCPPAAIKTPVAMKIANLRHAMRRWLANGLRIAPSAIRKERAAICRMCPHWNPAGNLGLGECRAPGCGCTRAKIWLASESCPVGKWKAIR